MLVGSVSSDVDDTDALSVYGTSTSWNGRRVEIFDTKENNQLAFATNIISSDRPSNAAKGIKIAPMGGGASVSVEKDSDGNTTVGAEVEHTSSDGTYEVKAEVSVNQDGDVSGKASVGVNWDKD